MRTVLVGTALLLGGCANLFDEPGRPDPVVEVIATVSQCGVSDPGVFSSQSASADFSPDLRQELDNIDPPPEREALVVALGDQPTPGYSLAMQDARWFGYATLNVSMAVEAPAEEMLTAQVITEPCVILDVPAQGWSQIRVEADLPGFPVAWVRRDE